MASYLTTKLCDVHYNLCFEEHAGHVFILPTDLDILSHIGLKITNKIILLKWVSVCKKNQSVPRDTVWHHEALPSDANSGLRQTCLSVSQTHVGFFFLHTFWGQGLINAELP